MCSKFLFLLFKTILFIICSQFLLIQHALTQQTSRVFQFLDLNQHARSAAIGGHHPAFESPDFSLFTLNPAFLSMEQNHTLQVSYINHISDVNFGSASFHKSFDKLGSFGASLHVLNYGDLTRFDESGNDLGDFSANDLSLSLGWALKLKDQWHAGVALTGIYSSLESFSSSALTATAGIFYNSISNRTQLGASFRHAGYQLSTFNGRQEPLPFDISIGAAHKLETLPFRLYATLRNLHDWDLRTANDEDKPSAAEQIFRHTVFGSEILLGDSVTFRLGYDSLLHEQTKTGKRIDGAGLSMGFGLKLKTTEIDIARTSFSDIGNLIQLSLKLAI